MRILVTGATGFIGISLTKALKKDGHVVSALTRGSGRGDRLQAGVEAIHQDGSTASILRGFQNFQPDLVVHLASKYLAAHSSEDVEDLVKSNILFGCQVLESMASCGTKLLVNLGTSFQHYTGDDYNPVSLYAATKQAFEDLARYYVEAKGLSVVTLKLSDTYGRNDERGKIISLLCRLARSSETLDLSPGEQRINFVHVDDVVAAITIAIKRLTDSLPGKIESFAIRGAETMSLRDFVTLFEDVSNCKINVRWGARSYRDREVMEPWLGELLPEWRPRVTLREGLKDLLKHV
jgi:nucleoside-diphosphate-sugar epimerase